MQCVARQDQTLPRWHPCFLFGVRFDIEPKQEVRSTGSAPMKPWRLQPTQPSASCAKDTRPFTCRRTIPGQPTGWSIGRPRRFMPSMARLGPSPLASSPTPHRALRITRQTKSSGGKPGADRLAGRNPQDGRREPGRRDRGHPSQRSSRCKRRGSIPMARGPQSALIFEANRIEGRLTRPRHLRTDSRGAICPSRMPRGFNRFSDTVKDVVSKSFSRSFCTEGARAGLPRRGCENFSRT